MREDKPKLVEITVEEAAQCLDRLAPPGTMYCVDQAVPNNPIPALVLKLERDGLGVWYVKDRFTLQRAEEIINERLVQMRSA